MHLLFSYGTFQSPYVQKRIFGREIPMQKASLDGYAAFSCADGYSNLLPCAGSVINGSLLPLTDRELLIADGWELCPTMYIRREMALYKDGIPLNAWVYFRADACEVGEQIKDGTLCTLPNEQLERELDEYADELKLRGLL